MGLFSSIFRSSEGGTTVKVQEKKSDLSVERGHRFVETGGEKHTHESYSLDKASGSYREYHGGENSPDRSYNK